MGTQNSQDVYQIYINQILQGLPGVITIHDDITIHGKDDEEDAESRIKRTYLKYPEVYNQANSCILLCCNIQQEWNES